MRKEELIARQNFMAGAIEALLSVNDTANILSVAAVNVLKRALNYEPDGITLSDDEMEEIADEVF